MQIPYKYHLTKWLKDQSVALVDNLDGKKLVIKEYPLAGVLTQLSEKVRTYSRSLKTVMPEFSQSEGFLIRPYVQGAVAGDTDKTFGFEKEALAKIDPEILARVLYELNFFTSADFIKQAGLEIRNAAWYLKNIEEVKETIKFHFGSDGFSLLVSYLHNDLGQVNKNTNFLINGDLHPQNIFYNCLYSGEARNFMITDWDLLQINNPGFDLSLLYIWSWRDRSWYERLFSSFVAFFPDKKQDIAVCCSFCQAYLAAQVLRHTSIVDESKLNDEEKSNREGLRNFCLEILRRIISRM